MDAQVPLVVSEVNPHALDSIPKRIVANPNCTTMAAMPVLKPLHAEAQLIRLVASTYQAVSGGGIAGIEDLETQVEAVGGQSASLARNGDAFTFPAPKKFSAPIAFNVLPFAGAYSGSEGAGPTKKLKLTNKKQLRYLEIPDLPVSSAYVCACPYAHTGR